MSFDAVSALIAAVKVAAAKFTVVIKTPTMQLYHQNKIVIIIIRLFCSNSNSRINNKRRRVSRRKVNIF